MELKTIVKKENESVSPKPGDQGSYKIIVIEDDEGLNRLIRKHLEREGFRTESALNGTEAFSKISGTGDEILLLDYVMPDMTAKEILSNLSQKQKRIPFIIMTGHGDEKIAVDMMKLGAIDYIVKEQNLTDILIPKIERACAEMDNEQKLSQAESALRESEEKLRTIIEHSNELFFIHDTEHSLTYASQTSIDLLGYTPEEMMIKWTELATDNPVNQKGLEVTEKGIATGEKQAPYLLELAKKDGTNVWLEIDESPVKDAAGKVVAISGAARDVTEQKWTEQRLLKSEKGFRDLFDSITDLIYTQDLDGRFITVNRGMVKVFGYEKDEFIGRPASDFMKPEMMPFFKSGYLEQIKTKGRQEGITGYFAKNGDKIYIDYRSSLIEPDDGEPYISGTGRDVTEQVLSRKEIKRLQNQILQSQKMKAIGTLAGGVAHDLNNILGGLVSYPELLLLQISEDSPLRKPILTIQKSGEKAAAVVQDLLTLARRGVVVTEVVKLNDVIAEYLESPEHEKLLSYHPGVHLETHLENDALNILGSSTHLSKTVMNLVSNAAEAMPEGGNLIVSTENRYIDRPIKGYDDVKEGDYVILTISDTGTGIASDDLDKIFEPFYTKKKMGRSGTGLGMAVVWGTVKDHNGYIDVQSTEGKARPPRLSARDGGQGTTFTLYFPVTRNKLAEDKSSLSVEACSGNGECILIVDDVEEQRQIASGMLEELGYSAVSVSSGEEAVEYLRTNKIDLLVLDMIMDPGMDGLETYRKIIEIHPGQKAIIASGFSETDRVKEVQSLGAGAYIRKPLLLEKIGIAVKGELEKQAVFELILNAGLPILQFRQGIFNPQNNTSGSLLPLNA